MSRAKEPHISALEFDIIKAAFREMRAQNPWNDGQARRAVVELVSELCSEAKASADLIDNVLDDDRYHRTKPGPSGFPARAMRDRPEQKEDESPPKVGGKGGRSGQGPPALTRR